MIGWGAVMPADGPKSDWVVVASPSPSPRIGHAYPVQA